MRFQSQDSIEDKIAYLYNKIIILENQIKNLTKTKSYTPAGDAMKMMIELEVTVERGGRIIPVWVHLGNTDISLEAFDQHSRNLFLHKLDLYEATAGQVDMMQLGKEEKENG